MNPRDDIEADTRASETGSDAATRDSALRANALRVDLVREKDPSRELRVAPVVRTTKRATPKAPSQPVEVKAALPSGNTPKQPRLKATKAGAGKASGKAASNVDAEGDTWLKASGLKATAIDALMERASQALIACDYFRAQEMCLRALDKALASSDFERCARAILPLQEARRQLRHLATDEAETTRGARAVHVLRAMPRTNEAIAGGFYLLEPPLVGIDASTFRMLAQRAKAPTMVLVKEPTTKSGLWPIVGVGTGEPFPVVARVLVEPPKGLAGAKSLLDADAKSIDNTSLVAWMLAAQERLGDAAIAKVKNEWPADHRVLDFAELFAAVPDHEKLAQAFAATCREAAKAPRSAFARRRGVAENKYSF